MVTKFVQMHRPMSVARARLVLLTYCEWAKDAGFEGLSGVAYWLDWNRIVDRRED